MKLNNKITINLHGRQIETDELSMRIIDDSFSKSIICFVSIIYTLPSGVKRPFNITRRPIVLWDKAAYDSVGNWTQEQAESKLLEILGEDIKTSLENNLV